MATSFNLYLVRHGESEHAANGIYQSTDVGLSERGREQAISLGNRFKSLNIDYLASSGFGRARETAEIIEKIINITPESIENLKELKRPSEIMGKPTDDSEVESIKKNIFDNWENPNYRYSDEETLFEFTKRVNKTIKLIPGLNKDNMVFVTHENFIRMFVLLVGLGASVIPMIYARMYKFTRIYNGAIVNLRYEDGNWKLISWNDVNHLTEK